MITKAIKKVKDFVSWVDCHPRLGWYIALMVTLHIIIDIAQSLL